MVDHILYSVPMRYINNALYRKVSDIHEKYRIAAERYAYEEKSILYIDNDGEYISNHTFCDFIEKCT